jgi:hypothetical protein
MKTQITNNAAARFIGYLPPHGKILANGASELVEGDLRTVLGGGRNRYGRPAEIAALDADLASGDITYTEVAEQNSSSSA